MTDSESEELITIGAAARASGLTASALRFYDDSGLLVPARVDAATGYRYYAPEQCERAVLIRRLREIAIPLDAVAEILSGDPSEAGRILDDHVRALTARAEQAALVAAAVKQTIGATTVTLSAPALAEAIGQVVDAAARDDTIAVLACVYLEVDADSVTLTATDRYRLATRTLVPDTEAATPWRRIVRARELAALSLPLSGADAVALSRTDSGITLRGRGIDADCSAVDGEYPDYRAMLAGLAPVRTRTVVDRAVLLAALETTDLDITAGVVRVAAEPGALSLCSAAPVESFATPAEPLTAPAEPHAASGMPSDSAARAPQPEIAVDRRSAATRPPTAKSRAAAVSPTMFATIPAQRISVANGEHAPTGPSASPGTESDSRPPRMRRIPAVGSGPRIDLAFDPATLRPAIAAALGPDIMLDIAGPDQPVVVRSATDGDLTSLVMPRAVPAELDTKEIA